MGSFRSMLVSLLSQLLLGVLLQLLSLQYVRCDTALPGSSSASASSGSARFYHLPMHEVSQQSVFIQTSKYDELVVAFAEKGSELKTGDYLTHADGIRLLNGGLSGFLKSGEKEVLVPVIDDEEDKFGGKKLIGFVMLQAVVPRKLSVRRGEIFFDMDEGGSAPTLKLGNVILSNDGVKSTTSEDYAPPPHGGGACITSRDCFSFNGTCSMGQCSCLGVYTGSYCQLNRPDFAAAAVRKKATEHYQQQKLQQQQMREVGMSSKKSVGTTTATATAAAAPKIDGTADVILPRVAVESTVIENTLEAIPEAIPESVPNPEEPSKKIKKKKKKPKPLPQDDSMTQNDGDTTKIEETRNNEENEEPKERELTVEELYGPGKAYPEPYVAGRLPGQTMAERHNRRTARESFIYSVRYRSGPLGIVFDNKRPDATIVEQVVKGQQSQQSDVKEGDKLIAVEQYNLTTAPAKVTLRLLNSMPWPRTLVFETTYEGEDPSVIEMKKRSRLLNITIVYPPTLVGEYAIRLSEWTPLVNLTHPINPSTQQKYSSVTEPQICPLYRIKSADDPFGCRFPQNAFKLPPSFDDMVTNNGFVSPEAESDSQFLALLLQSAFTKRIGVDPRSLSIMKRGECTFVEKAKLIAANGAHAGIVVNHDNELLDLPAGKEKTGECVVPFGLIKQEDGYFLHLAARTNEIWAVISDSTDGMSPMCDKLTSTVEDLIDRWPHTVPPISTQKILQNKPPDQSKVRGLTEEGGRIALSGENGWTFFDYHLAMFGPQEVPLGPLKLIMAMPPFGCDPTGYSVRIADSVVAILRGGGCSFGIKVINAQKLGAKAVMIVNTDDMKTMRLMALPDEVPLIKIPCIMVSRRIQYYLEEQIRPYYPIDNHLVSIQPTGVFGDYEMKNSLKLPPRLST